MKRFLIALCLALATTLSLASEGFAAPKGSVKLTSKNLSKKSGYYCGYVKKKWIPGKLVAGGFFYSHSAERSNLQKQLPKAKGNKKKSLKTKIAQLTKQISSRGAVCSKSGGGSKAGKLAFDLAGAVGVALKARTASAQGDLSTRASSSNLYAVDSAGRLSPAISSGSATVEKFLVAANDKLYLLLSNSSDNCVLAEVDTDNGTTTCIDKSIDSVEWTTAPRNNAIQFDGAGAIYYLAKDDGTTFLRKYQNGVRTDLTNSNITVSDFLVLSDGSAIIFAQTTNTNSYWIRRVTTAGGLETIRNIQSCNQKVTFMRQFPDQNIYFGIDDCNLQGVYRMGPSASALEGNPWFGAGAGAVEYDCTVDSGNLEQWLYNCGTGVKELHTTPFGKVFGVSTVGWNNQRNAIVQYFDEHSRPSLVIADVKVFQAVINNFIVAGLDGDGKNRLTLYDLVSETETQLIGPDNEIEIYHLAFVAAENKIMFDGLRFSDNRYVIGQVDLTTMQFVASSTGSSKLLDFQSLY
jgi:hypothetical protein